MLLSSNDDHSPTVVDNGDQRRKSECDRKTLKVQETAGGQECAVSEDETQSGSLPIKSVGQTSSCIGCGSFQTSPWKQSPERAAHRKETEH